MSSLKNLKKFSKLPQQPQIPFLSTPTVSHHGPESMDRSLRYVLDSESSFVTLADRNKGKTGKKTDKSKRKSLVANQCDICEKEMSDKTKCPIDSCPAMYHMTCLSVFCLDDPNQLIPIHFSCPNCQNKTKWGTFIRLLKNQHCYERDDPEDNPFIGANRINERGFHSSKANGIQKPEIRVPL